MLHGALQDELDACVWRSGAVDCVITRSLLLLLLLLLLLRRRRRRYDRHQKELEEKLDEKTAQLIHLQRVTMEYNAASPVKNEELQRALGGWAPGTQVRIGSVESFKDFYSVNVSVASRKWLYDN